MPHPRVKCMELPLGRLPLASVLPLLTYRGTLLEDLSHLLILVAIPSRPTVFMVLLLVVFNQVSEVQTWQVTLGLLLADILVLSMTTGPDIYHLMSTLGELFTIKLLPCRVKLLSLVMHLLLSAIPLPASSSFRSPRSLHLT
jgi:hypothetical protein